MNVSQKSPLHGSPRKCNRNCPVSDSSRKHGAATPEKWFGEEIEQQRGSYCPSPSGSRVSSSPRTSSHSAAYETAPREALLRARSGSR